ncbi:hypothetical protein ACT3SP_15420 [Brachybacterium sp. AOP43-C2-M15]|uniref:hypothetical protein n=1 Tax=Brachybacterium sp. AOP43-C2-M15 TaxID=3457661 RepID=UPI00403473B5
MASDHAEHTVHGRTVTEARSALADLEQDGARLAGRFPTPWGVLGIHAAILAVFVGSEILDAPWGILLGSAAALGAGALLATAFRRSGVRPAMLIGRRATWLFLALLGAVMLAKIAVWILLDIGANASWAVIPVATAFIGVVLLGAASHREMRAQLVRRGDRRP